MKNKRFNDIKNIVNKSKVKTRDEIIEETYKATVSKVLDEVEEQGKRMQKVGIMGLLKSKKEDWDLRPKYLE